MTEIFKILEGISHDLSLVKKHILEEKKSPLKKLQEVWTDAQGVMQTIHISRRTLQALRDSGELPFSRINSKFYYKINDLETLISKNYQPSKNRKK